MGRTCGDMESTPTRIRSRVRSVRTIPYSSIRTPWPRIHIRSWARRSRESRRSRFPSLGNGVIDIPGNVSAKTLDKKFRRGYVESFNFTVQREIGSGFVGQVGYVGTRGIRQQVSQELNYAPIGTGNAGAY